MRNSSILLAISLALALTSLVRSQEPSPAPVSAAYLYDAKSKESTPVILTEIGLIKKPFGLKTDFRVSAYAGLKLERPFAGTWISYKQNVAQNAALRFGPAISYDGRFRSPGFIFGFEIQF
jgi:hypothetical protein